MLKFNVAAIKDGQSTLSMAVSPKEIGLEENEEFSHIIHITHHINKVGHEVFIKADVETALSLQCDVCLDSFLSDVKITVDVILTSDSDLSEREDDVYLVPDVTSEVDITDSIRQSLLIEIPFQKKCRPDCKGLCSTCGANLNAGECGCTHEKNDPRWDALKKLKFD